MAEGFKILSLPDETPTAPTVDGFRLVEMPFDKARMTPTSEGMRPALQGPLESRATAEMGRPTKLQSLGIGGAQGLAANFLDELSGALGATFDKRPDETWAQAYERHSQAAAQKIANAEAANPKTFLAGQVGGGVAGALALPAVGTGVRGAAATGALYGGLAGAGAGEGLADRALQAGAGAVVGGVAGAAVPKVLDAAVGAGRALGQATQGVTNRVRAAVNPEGEAFRRVQTALERDAAMGHGMDDATLQAARGAGQPVAVVDVGGETTRALARAAANESPEGREVLNQLVHPRFESQGARVTDFVRSLVGTADATATREWLETAAQRANRPAYAKAYAQGSRGVWDGELAQLAQAPVVQEAIRDATRKGANRAAAEGFRPVRNPFTVDDAGVRLSDDKVTPPIQFWDYVQRDLRDTVGKLKRSGADDEARVVESIRRQLNEHLDAVVPDFGAARAGAAKFFGAESALEAGEKFVRSTTPNAEARRAIGKMSQPEKALFAEGFASSLIEQVNRTGDRRNVVNAMFGTPASRERIEIALGKGRSDELEAFLRRETIIDAIRGALGNSTTTRQLLEAASLGVGGYSFTSGDMQTATMGVLAAGLSRGSRAVNQKVARKVAELLASEDPAAIKRATTIVARSPQIREALKGAEDYIVRAVAPQAGANANFLSGPLSSAASDRKLEKEEGR